MKDRRIRKVKEGRADLPCYANCRSFQEGQIFISCWKGCRCLCCCCAWISLCRNAWIGWKCLKRQQEKENYTSISDACDPQRRGTQQAVGRSNNSIWWSVAQYSASIAEKEGEVRTRILKRCFSTPPSPIVTPCFPTRSSTAPSKHLERGEVGIVLKTNTLRAFFRRIDTVAWTDICHMLTFDPHLVGTGNWDTSLTCLTGHQIHFKQQQF